MIRQEIKSNNRFYIRFAGFLMISVMTLMMVSPGCRKDKWSDWETFYRYFPVEEGYWVEYEVDSTAYNGLLDTVLHYSYRVRETILEKFTDLAGEEWQRIDHETFRDSAQGWTAGAVYAQRRSKNTAERIEQNLRFIRLVFPIRKSVYWQGNSYVHYDDLLNCNFWGDWEYSYKDLFVSKEIGSHTFDSVVVVQQVADSGLVCKNLWLEMYTPGIGMIYRHTERLTTQKTSPDPFYLKAENGYIVTYSLIDWKK